LRRRLVEICLLAYPRTRRDPDREYLRDLALELGDAYGLRRQAISLVRGGLAERLDSWRRVSHADASTWMRRTVVAGAVLAAIALTSSVIGTATGEGERVEIDRATCVDVRHRGDDGDREPIAFAGCSDARSIAAQRASRGWDCSVRHRVRDTRREISWECRL
jgi:uncharacterized membrane protein